MTIVRPLAFLLAAVVGCGGQVFASPPSNGKDAGNAASSDRSTADAIVSEVGITDDCHIRGAALCDIPSCQTACSGLDCFHFVAAYPLEPVDRSPFGVCDVRPLQEAFSKGSGECPVCAQGGSLCLAVGGGSTRQFCVTIDTCKTLVTRGLPNECSYQDRTKWSPGQAIPDVACPTTGTSARLCGGGCGPCATPGEFCIGRSSTHPIGICVPPASAGGHDGHPCDRTIGCNGEPASEACALWTTHDTDTQPLADLSGVCIGAARCAVIRATLPGGLSCVDHTGHDLP
jgi:hypothetical protein